MKLPYLILSSILFITLSSYSSADSGDINPAQPEIPSTKFNIKDFADIKDGKNINTDTFKKAIHAVAKSGGGTLIIPAGDYSIGPIELPSHIDLHLEAGAKIIFSANPKEYPISRNRKGSQILIYDSHDVSISGLGTIDGNGQIWWPAANAMRDPITGKQYNGTTPRPSMLMVSHSKRIRVEGVTLTRSPGLNFGISESSDITVEGISILNPSNSPNTDGIDPKGAQRVLISHCQIDTGDDCIAAGGSRGMLESDILVTDCAFFHGHGCSIGSGTAGGVMNFKVRRCTFNGTETGVRLKSSRGRGGDAENIIYEDLTMNHVGRAISINSHYEGTTVDLSGIGQVNAEPVNALTPQWKHVVIRNIHAINCTRDAGLILGLPEMPVEDVVLENISIEAPEGMRIGYTHKILLKYIKFNVQNGQPLSIASTVTALNQ
jgi:polygalacturonase